MNKDAAPQSERELGDRPLLSDVLKSSFYNVAKNHWATGINDSQAENPSNKSSNSSSKVKSKKSLTAVSNNKNKSHNAVISEIFNQLANVVKSSSNATVASTSLLFQLLTLDYLKYLER